MEGRVEMSGKRGLVGGAAIGILCLAAVAVAQTAITQKLPADIKFNPVPFAPGAEVGFLASDGNKPEMYTLRVRLAKDAKIPPHTHPDSRMVTILSGELFAGIGPTFDPEHGTLLPEGSFMVIPAGEVHWSWAKNGDVVYQETGNGPTTTNLIKQ
jgi:quercetin dioxygenase-like cupin family protein